MSLLSYCVKTCPGVTQHDENLDSRFHRLAVAQDTDLVHRLDGYRAKSARIIEAINGLNPHARHLVLRHLETHVLSAVRHAVQTKNAHPALVAIKKEGTLIAHALGLDLEDHGAV